MDCVTPTGIARPPSHKEGRNRRRLQGGVNLGVAGLALLAGLVIPASAALALDKVTFGTNWLADPEAGGYYQAVVDGTYAKYGLDVAITAFGGDAKLQQALAAHGKAGDFYDGKRLAARYFFHYELPKTTAQFDLLDNGDRTTIDLDENWF